MNLKPCQTINDVAKLKQCFCLIGQNERESFDYIAESIKNGIS